MRFIPVIIFFFIGMAVYSQSAISGIVKSADGNPLGFSTIIQQNGNVSVTDLDGKFNIVLQPGETYFTVSYLGYQSKKINFQKDKIYYSIQLSEQPKTLDEIVINTYNSNRIINTAIRLKKYNNPQEKLNSFRYKSYERLIISANPDSLKGVLDSVYVYEKAGRRFEKIDSVTFKFKKIIQKQHLYQTEKVSEFSFNTKQGLKEKVLATRMAGFKQPLYEIIGLTFQSHSIYKNKIEIFETKYLSPLADNARSEYNYRVLDTVRLDNREVYRVHFLPKKVNKKRRLEGLLYIDANNYGIAQSVFTVKGMLDITSIHFFKYEPGLDIWFPDNKTLKIVKGDNKKDIRILGETIRFNTASEDSLSRGKSPSDYIYLISSTKNFDKEFNIPVDIKRPYIAVEIDKEAIFRPENYWNDFRNPLDERSANTYMSLDSLIAKDRWEQRIILGKKVINGYLPVGFIDLNLRHIIKYNNHEGFRTGLGGVTNDKFSEIFKINGYGAYGSKDGRFKYQAGSSVRIDKFSETWLGLSYTDDVKEIGSISFEVDKRPFKIYDPQPINLTTFYNYKSWELYTETKIIPKTEGKIIIAQNRIEPRFFYEFNTDAAAYTYYDVTTATASVQWNPFSDFMQTPSGRIEVEKRFPKFTLQYTQALNSVLGGDFNFSKLDLRSEFEIKYLNGQKTSAMVQAGMAFGDVPLTHLYSTSPNNLDKDGVLGRITFAGKNSFETMYFNEFFSNRYMLLQAKHGLGKFTLAGSLKLSPVLVTRAAWGSMEHQEKHIGIDYNTLEKGYYESGFEFNEIFKGLGFSMFYRYGPYHLPNFDRNLSLKLSFIINLGI